MFTGNKAYAVDWGEGFENHEWQNSQKLHWWVLADKQTKEMLIGQRSRASPTAKPGRQVDCG